MPDYECNHCAHRDICRYSEAMRACVRSVHETIKNLKPVAVGVRCDIHCEHYLQMQDTQRTPTNLFRKD